MGLRPGAEYTLERIDDLKGYSKDNCVWATSATQAQNRAYCKIAHDKANYIRHIYTTRGYRQVDIAKRFGVSQRTVSLIVRNEAWVA